MSDKIECSHLGCTQPWFVTCVHAAYCVDHMFAGACGNEDCAAEIGLAFVRYMRLVVAPSARLCAQLAPTRFLPLDISVRIYEHLITEYRAWYEEAGAPLGPLEDDMWRWHEERLSAPAH